MFVAIAGMFLGTTVMFVVTTVLFLGATLVFTGGTAMFAGGTVMFTRVTVMSVAATVMFVAADANPAFLGARRLCTRENAVSVHVVRKIEVSARKLANPPKVRCPPLAAPASFAPTKQTIRRCSAPRVPWSPTVVPTGPAHA